MNILMIEDDRELCSAVSFRLEQEGFSVTLCHDGEEGLYYMQETPYDLVILDRMLPHMNGIEILKEARSRQIKTPFIILTALGELNDRLTGLNCGADDYMVKPFAFEEELKEKMERLNALNIELNLDEKDTSVMDTEPEQREEQSERKCVSHER